MRILAGLCGGLCGVLDEGYFERRIRTLTRALRKCQEVRVRRAQQHKRKKKKYNQRRATDEESSGHSLLLPFLFGQRRPCKNSVRIANAQSQSQFLRPKFLSGETLGGSRATFRFQRNVRFCTFPKYGYRHTLCIPKAVLWVLPDGLAVTIFRPPSSSFQLEPFFVSLIAHAAPSFF